jgi:hypothetical protein
MKFGISLIGSLDFHGPLAAATGDAIPPLPSCSKSVSVILALGEWVAFRHRFNEAGHQLDHVQPFIKRAVH